MNSPFNEDSRPEKALWYQEVLSLDPASRIFLPYARLLARTGRRMEAVEVLRSGLARHPEFLDARLLLIDLLHDCGQDAAAGLEASGIIESLSRCSALWEIWSRLPGVRADQSAMLLFFGATFREGGPSLADVFEAGMKALREEDRKNADASREHGEDTADACADDAEKEPSLPKGAPETPPDSERKTEAENAPSGNAASCAAPNGQADANDSETPAARAFVMDENAPWYSLDAVPDDDDIYNDEEGEEQQTPAAPPVPPSAMQLFFPESRADSPEEEQNAPAERSIPRASSEGKSSLCTRSMARILEEQGATGEAADIYRELLEVSSSDEERAELNAKLDSLMQGTETAAPDQSADSGLLDMLETLAVRLENKARA